MINQALAKFQPAAVAVFRVAAGLLFLQHGLQKLFGTFGGIDGSGTSATLMSQLGLAGVLEAGGGLLIAIGLLTQPVALILLVEMLWAYAQAHMPRGGVPVQNQGELALVYAAIWVYFATHGAGRYSVDARMKKG